MRLLNQTLVAHGRVLELLLLVLIFAASCTRDVIYTHVNNKKCNPLTVEKK